LIRHRGLADGDDTCTIILLNQDGSQNGSGQDCGASRLCALSRDSTTTAAAAAIRCYRKASDRVLCERVLVAAIVREHVVGDSDRHGDYDMIVR